MCKIPPKMQRMKDIATERSGVKISGDSFSVRLRPHERGLLNEAAISHRLSLSALLRAGGLRLARALIANTAVDALERQGDESSDK